MPAEEGVRTVREAVGIFNSPRLFRMQSMNSSVPASIVPSLVCSRASTPWRKGFVTNTRRWACFQTIQRFPEQPTYQRRRLETRKAG